MNYWTYFFRFGGILLFCATVLFAQPPHPLDFFPHHQGDVWEYWYQENPPGFTIVQNIITLDSLGDDGRYYIEMTEFLDKMVDTTTYRVYSFDGEELFYKLDADSGDSWVVDTLGQGWFRIAIVSDVVSGLIFSIPSTVKIIKFYEYFTDVQESLWVGTHYLASRFGIIQRDAELAFPEYLLKGAIIDGVLYGTVPIDEADNPEIPEQFVLHQNYPNPFNPVTTISYQLSTESKVKLTIYNLRGQAVRTLVNGNQPAGTYTVKWNGRNDNGVLVASGVYFYRLNAGNSFVATRKMVLLR